MLSILMLISDTGVCQCGLGGASRHDLAPLLPDQFLLWLHRLCLLVLHVQQAFATARLGRAGGL